VAVPPQQVLDVRDRTLFSAGEAIAVMQEKNPQGQ
jgi:hypothetical protein